MVAMPAAACWRSTRRSRSRSPLERRFHGVPLKASRRSELTQLVSYHLLANVYGDELPSIVYRDRVSNHVGQNG